MLSLFLPLFLGEVRDRHGLEPFTEDSLEVTKHMRSSTPPASAADILEAQQNQKRSTRPVRRVRSDIIPEEAIFRPVLLMIHFLC